MTAYRTALTALGGIAATGAAGVAYASLIERNLFTLREFTVPVLPPGTPSLRLLQVSDLHLVARQQRKVEWVRRLAQLEPDFVVNSGDNLGSHGAVPEALRAMEPLMDFPGAFVLGSNDYYGPQPKNPARYLTKGYARAPKVRPRLPVKHLVDGLTRGGWHNLNNARALLSVSGVPLEFVGVNDPHVSFDRYAKVAGPASPEAALTVGLVHAPYQRVLDPMTADGAGLIVAGHTHGGQLAVPVMGALVTNCDLDRRRAKGVSRWWEGAGDDPSSSAPADAAWLHVSAGLGTSPYAPVRFACRPEATLLTLTSRS